MTTQFARWFREYVSNLAQLTVKYVIYLIIVIVSIIKPTTLFYVDL